MIDPILSLCFSMHANKGVYVPLLGSGVSRAAGILTGWEITLDLIRKLAHLQNENCEPDPEKWYQSRHERQPDYSELLSSVAKSSTERNQLLRSYFEPTDLEREEGLKSPTAAHRSIAKLVNSGYVRVILTTNFDRLMEMALEASGIVPTVISNSDAIQGSIPLTHTRCTIVKIHGDYLDIRFKNTPVELDRFDESLSKLLDRILDEFGLIVCGWSAKWDRGLRSAIERCNSRRFATYWCYRGEMEQEATSLVASRRGEIIRIANADSFFQDLDEKVTSLEDLQHQHPISAKLATATLKRLLPNPTNKIRVSDLVSEEASRIHDELESARFPTVVDGFEDDDMPRRMHQYESLIESLQSMLIVGCCWGNDEQTPLWSRSLEIVADVSTESRGFAPLLNLRRYPALVLLYSAGISAIAASNYENLRAVLIEAQGRLNYPTKSLPLASILHPEAVVLGGWAQRALGESQKYYVPRSEYLYRILREPLKEVLSIDGRYDKAFDRFEYLFALVNADQKARHTLTNQPRFTGRFFLPMEENLEEDIINIVDAELKQAGKDWPPLQAGFFDGSLESLEEQRQQVKAAVTRWRNHHL